MRIPIVSVLALLTSLPVLADCSVYRDALQRSACEKEEAQRYMRNQEAIRAQHQRYWQSRQADEAPAQPERRPIDEAWEQYKRMGAEQRTGAELAEQARAQEQAREQRMAPARRQEQAGHFDRCLETTADILKHAVWRTESYAEAKEIAGKCHQGKGQLDAAIDDYTQAIESYGSYWTGAYRIYRRLWTLYALNGRYPEALALKRDIRYTDHHDYLTDIAIEAANEGRTAEAVALLQLGLEEESRTPGKQAIFDRMRRNLATIQANGHSREEYERRFGELSERTIRLHEAGKYPEAVVAAQAVLAFLDQPPDRHPEADDRRVTALHNLAWSLASSGRHAEAESALKQALAIREKPTSQATFGLYYSFAEDGLAKALVGLANLYRQQQRHAEAEPLRRRLHALLEKTQGPGSPATLIALNHLAVDLNEMGRRADAEALFRKGVSLAETNADAKDALTLLRGNLAGLLRGSGRPDAADALLAGKRLADLPAAPAKPAADWRDDWRKLYDTALRMNEDDDADQAVAIAKAREALALAEQKGGAQHRLVAESRNTLAVCLRTDKQHPEAEKQYLQALREAEAADGKDSDLVAIIATELATLYDFQDRHAEALPLHRRALAIRGKGANLLALEESLGWLARHHKIQRQYAEAEPYYRRLVELAEHLNGRDHPAVAKALNELGHNHLMLNRYADAEPLHLRALAIADRDPAKNRRLLRDTLDELVSLYTWMKKVEERERYRQRRDGLAQGGPAQDRRV
jgi:hypothetical protein